MKQVGVSHRRNVIVLGNVSKRLKNYQEFRNGQLYCPKQNKQVTETYYIITYAIKTKNGLKKYVL